MDIPPSIKDFGAAHQKDFFLDLFVPPNVQRARVGAH
jgi:hypothetical protein